MKKPDIFNKKSGFTLTELIIAIAIVAILAVLTIPIIGKRLDKVDEFSYYMAYKSIEKMAAQIIIDGDPEESTAAVLTDDEFATRIAQNNNTFADYLKDRYSNSMLAKSIDKFAVKISSVEDKIFKKVYQKANAVEPNCPQRDGYEGRACDIKTDFFNTEEYDKAWIILKVCKNKSTSVPCEQEGTNTVNFSRCTEAEVQNGSCNGGCKINCSEYGFANAPSPSGGGTSPEAPVGPYNPGPGTENIQRDRTVNDYASLLGEIFNDNYCKKPSSQIDFDDMVSAMNLSEQRPNLSTFCTGFYKNECGIEGIDGSERYENPIYKISGYAPSYNPPSTIFGSREPRTSLRNFLCTTKKITYMNYSLDDEDTSKVVLPSYGENVCEDYGYVNATNVGAPHSLDCQCKPGYVPSANNDKACAESSYIDTFAEQNSLTSEEKSKMKIYYIGSSNTKCQGNGIGGCKPYSTHKFAYCPNGFGSHVINSYVSNYNGQTVGYCCSRNQYSNGTTCACKTGYKQSSSANATYGIYSCEFSFCPKGYHKAYNSTNAGQYCVKNAPVIKGERFCELIKDNWNINDSKCNTFTTQPASYYQNLLNAVKGSDGKYMSIQSKPAAFADLQPNIVFANGLKMWILGDKSASIPWLTSYDANESKIGQQNMCEHLTTTENRRDKIDEMTKENCENNNNNGYYCETEKYCVKIHNPTAGMDDARGCCGVKDLRGANQALRSAMSGFTVFVDINGDKGDGTLWEDVFPFFITGEGKVIPAYPLNASDEEGQFGKYIGGNDPKRLSAEVYLYYKDRAGNKKKEVVFSDVSYAKAACLTGTVKEDTPYCNDTNLGSKYMKTPNSGKQAVKCDGNYYSGPDYDSQRMYCQMMIKKRVKFL